MRVDLRQIASARRGWYPAGLATPKPPKRSAKAHLALHQSAALAELAEVERALASLEGRDTGNAENLAVARQDAERRRVELERVVQVTRRALARRRRALVFRGVAAVLVAVAVAIAAAKVVPVLRAQQAERDLAVAAADRVAAPFLQAGFRKDEPRWGRGPHVVSGSKGTCFVAVVAAPRGPAHVQVQRGFVGAEAEGSVGWCTCGAEKVSVGVQGEEPVVLEVLGAPSRIVGGADVLASLTPRANANMPETVDRACAEAALDDWLNASARAAETAGALEGGEAALAALGLRAVASAPPERPLIALPDAKDTCFLARSREPSDSLSLRLRGGERYPAGKAALALCARDPSGLTVWREGKGALTVFSAPASRVGGLLGLGEAARRAALAPTPWIAGGDLEWDAASAMGASGIGPSYLLERSAGLDTASLFTFSTDARSTLTVDARTATVVCRPRLAVGAVVAGCAAAAPGAWKIGTELPQGGLAAKRPSWLPAPVGGDPRGLERTLDVLTFARAMTLLGFELTVLTGITATPEGAEVVGRSGEKEVVVVAVDALAPWVHTLSDREPWQLDGAPRIVPVAPGSAVRLHATPPYVGPRTGRELLVWRR